MSTTTKQAIDLMEILPEKDQSFALEFIKKLVIAWDPDFTKVTPTERAELERAQREIENGETVLHDAINWD
jgi:alkyl hydroperoxide reductase subunit AhpC